MTKSKKVYGYNVGKGVRPVHKMGTLDDLLKGVKRPVKKVLR